MFTRKFVEPTIVIKCKLPSRRSAKGISKGCVLTKNQSYIFLLKEGSLFLSGYYKVASLLRLDGGYKLNKQCIAKWPWNGVVEEDSVSETISLNYTFFF